MSNCFDQFGSDADADKPKPPAGETLRPVVDRAPAAGGDAWAKLLKRCRGWADKVPGLAEGGRNNQGFALAMAIREFVEYDEGNEGLDSAGVVLDFAGVLQIVGEWNQRNSPPMSQEELRGVVERAFKKPLGDTLKPSRPRPAGMRKQRPAPKPAGTVAVGDADDAPLPDDRDAVGVGDDAGGAVDHVPDATEMVSADVVGDLSAPGDDAAPGLEWQPVPLECLPETLARYIHEAAESIGCDPGFVFLPALATLAGAVAGGASIVLKKKYFEPLALWVGIVGVSGTGKSPALGVCVEPIQDKHKKAYREWRLEKDRYDEAELVFQKDLHTWKKNSGAGGPPTKPKMPIQTYFTLDDATTEAVGKVVSNDPGVLLIADELSTWVGNFGRYSGAAAGDVGTWIKFYSGRSTQIDRASTDPKNIENGLVSIAGGIQPQTFRRLVTGPLVESGLLARMLLAMPPGSPADWTEADISDTTCDEWRCVVDQLSALRVSEPVKLRIDGESRALWKLEYDAFGKLWNGLSESEKSMWSKLRGTAARFAGLLHCYRWAEGKGELGALCLADIDAGWKLARWFLHEGRRVYGLCGLTWAKVSGESVESRDRDARLLAWIARKGTVTPRELVHSNANRWPDVETAKRDLDRLVIAQKLQWRSDPAAKVGRPTEYYCLKTDGQA